MDKFLFSSCQDNNIYFINIEKLKDLEWERNKMKKMLSVQQCLNNLEKRKEREKVIKWKEMIKKRNYLKLKIKNNLI